MHGESQALRNVDEIISLSKHDKTSRCCVPPFWIWSLECRKLMSLSDWTQRSPPLICPSFLECGGFYGALRWMHLHLALSIFKSFATQSHVKALIFRQNSGPPTSSVKVLPTNSSLFGDADSRRQLAPESNSQYSKLAGDINCAL